MRLRLLLDTYAVAKVEGALDFSAWGHVGELVQIVRTRQELSVVCRDDAIPSGVTAERGWRCFTFVEALELDELGVLASLSVPLARAKVAIFVISTFENDYVLVRSTDLARALKALESAGFSIHPDAAPA